ncbi:hypothetical protein DW103_10495 [Parabacteroides sp. AM08-6]|nr:hypothetical protein DW103_10495 [Parabacteroides sp. AM08-6]
MFYNNIIQHVKIILFGWILKFFRMDFNFLSKEKKIHSNEIKIFLFLFLAKYVYLCYIIAN